MTQKSWFQDILIPTGDQRTYSELQDELDRRESIRLYIEQCVPRAMYMMGVTQAGALAFSLGMQCRAPRTEVC